jgi:cytochrome c peroxidase
VKNLLHILALCLAVPAAAGDLPRPLTDVTLPRPLTGDDFIAFDRKQAELGRLLFYDKILSGNRNISCGTCHHHDLGGSDGLSLGIGEGGEGLGPKRASQSAQDRIRKRIPRNAPALWNLGAKDIRVLFHDGRLETSDLYGNGFNSPAEEWLPQGLDTILAAQALFPLTARFEMAGDPEENEVGGAANDRIDNVWPIVAKRVRIIPGYGEMFVAAFDHIDRSDQVTIVEIANALAAFMGTEWRNHDSPFDRFLAGDATALSGPARQGMELFFGEAGCAACHSGPLLSDQKFHALGLPAFGPGKTRRFELQPRDVGRMAESDRLEDAYRFRTPMLRNVALTAPYGHNGAFPTLEGMVRHHLDPVGSRATWDRKDARLPAAEWLAAGDFIVQADAREMARQAVVLDIEPRPLGDAEIAALVAFLESLTGESALTRPLGRPERVPSGLSVD